MKKIFLLVYLFWLVFIGFALAETPLNYSADKTADALIRTGAANLYSVWFTLDGTNDVTVDIYDSLTATGTTVIPTTTIDASDVSHNTAVIYFNPAIKISTGIYIDITTAGAVTYKVYYNTKKY